MVMANWSYFTTLPWAGSGQVIQSLLRCSTSCQTCSKYLAGINPGSGEGNGNPLQCSCLENPRYGGAWCDPIYGVAQSRTQLKWLSSLAIPVQWYPGEPLEPSESPGTRFLLSQTLYTFYPKGPGMRCLRAGDPEKAGRVPFLPLEVSLCSLLPGTSSPTASAASCSPHCRLSTTCFQRPPGSGESGVCDGPHPWRRSGWNPGRQSLGGAVWGMSWSPSVHPRPWCQKAREWSRFPGRRPLAWKTHAGQSNGSRHPAVLGMSGSESQTISSWPSSRTRSWQGVWSLGFGQAPLGTFHLPSSWMNHGSLHKATKGRWAVETELGQIIRKDKN